MASAGAKVIHIGEVGTEEVYFAVQHLKVDGGIMVTASHNPKDYNGMKLVREEAKPVSSDTGLWSIRDRVQADESVDDESLGEPWVHDDTRPAYVEHVLSYVDVSQLPPFKVVSNPGNGAAGPVVEALAARLPFDWVKVAHEPDGHFPNGVPNPLLPENRPMTTEAVAGEQADFGLAWDGDFDRCFFFDEKGRFIEGYYVVGLLAEAFLNRAKASGQSMKIVHDTRLTWNTIDIVRKAGGEPIEGKTGHAFMKERLRQEQAVYGGEMSAHHFFQDFGYCDSGMIVWLLVAELMASTGKPLSELVDERMQAYPCSGEINFTIGSPEQVMASIESHFDEASANGEPLVRKGFIDGLTMEFERWRFNLRKSNTEPVVRLNVETRGDEALLAEKIELMQSLIEQYGQ